LHRIEVQANTMAQIEDSQKLVRDFALEEVIEAAMQMHEISRRDRFL
jgi:hypothetical protein